MCRSNKSWRSIILPKLHLLLLENTPIFEQLQIEEALLRTDERSVCLINFGSPRAIVMGTSAKAKEWVEIEKVRREKIPLIQRFSGGGTVIVDENTLFITFILSKHLIPISPFPESILRWSAHLYQKAWDIPHFQLRENDYCIEEKKCGGNAQYIRKERWLHHTSFLWDYSDENMDYLLLPPKKPKYRNNRSHTEFLARIKEYAKSPRELIEKLQTSLETLFTLEECPFPLNTPVSHRQSARLIDLSLC